MKKNGKFLLILTLFFGLVLRLISLNQSFWLDEATTANIAKNFNFSQIVSIFSPNDFHPPFYYLFTRAWGTVFGVGEVSLRFISIMFGLGTVYVIYLIGKEISSKIVGILSALFLATSGLHIYYSQEARMYAMSAFFVTFLIFLFLKIIKKPSKADWITFSIILALNSVTDYLPNLIVPVFWIYALSLKRKKKWWKMFAYSHLPLLVVWLWWLPVFSSQLASGLGVKTGIPGWWKVLGKTTLKEALLIPTKFILGRISFLNKNLYGAIVGFVGIIYSIIIVRRRNNKKKDESTKLVWMWLLVPILLSALIGLKISVFSYFRLIFVLPAFLILLAIGVSRLKGKMFICGVLFVLFVNLLSTGAYLTNIRFQREDWRGMVEFIENTSTDNSIVLFVANSQMEAFEYYKKDVKIAGPDKLSNKYDQIWAMRYVKDIFDPKDTLKTDIEDLGYEKNGEFSFNGIEVWEYIK